MVELFGKSFWLSFFLKRSGDGMNYKKIGDKYFIRIKKGGKIIQPLTEFLQKNKINLAYFHGLGALLEVEIGFYSLKQKKYHFKKYKDIEAVCIIGNSTLLKNEMPYTTMV